MLGTIALMSLTAAPPASPLRLLPGPHLFLDDHLIASVSRIERRVNRPVRDLPGPIVTGKEDGCFQPYVTVLRDPETRRYRLWYGVPENASQSHLATMESPDGIHWVRPRRVLADPARIQFGVSILDDGPAVPDPSRRFKYGWWNDGGLQVAGSPDGLTWRPLAPGVVLKHSHDINCIYRDAIRNRYVAIVSVNLEDPAWKGSRRIPHESVSDDLIHWREPWLILRPDAADPGETQFYSMSALLQRGDLLIGMVRVLRDDLPADVGGPVAGIGYTTLAWSRDGVHWERDREPFFDRDPRTGVWDHAMAWIGYQLPVGDQVYLYYGGYARGHKVERFTERQLGLVRIRRDRYVAREAGEQAGLLRTPLLRVAGSALTVNADAKGGELRARLLDGSGKPVPGFAFADCRAITTDSLAAPLRWKKPVSALQGRSVRLEFSLRRARLFALNVQP
jgi:hypothetical protein